MFGTALNFFQIISGVTHGAFAIHNRAKLTKSLILGLIGGLRCEDAAKSVNHIALIAINYISVRGLHFKTIPRRPRSTA